jgi:hypothetical protein
MGETFQPARRENRIPLPQSKTDAFSALPGKRRFFIFRG